MSAAEIHDMDRRVARYQRGLDLARVVGRCGLRAVQLSALVLLVQAFQGHVDLWLITALFCASAIMLLSIPFGLYFAWRLTRLVEQL